MARAGSGSSSSGSSSGGSRSFDGSSGGSFCVGGSSGRSGRSSSSRGSSHSGSSYRRSSSSHRSYNHGSYSNRYRGGHPGSDFYGFLQYVFSKVATLLVVLVVIILFVFFGGDSQKSTIQRERVESGLAFDNNVLLRDDINYISSETKLSSGMRTFYKETGVQPYFIFLAYDPQFKSDKQKEDWTTSYYDSNIKREDAILYVYFEEKNPEDNVGLMCYALGKQSASVFDAEAIEIWYNNIGSEWSDYSQSTEKVFEDAYTKTAKTIMRVSTTGKDVLKYVVIFVGVLGIGVVALKMFEAKRKAEKERAEETQEILNATLESLGDSLSSSGLDDLKDKYD